MKATGRNAARGFGGRARIALLVWLGGLAGAGWAQEGTNAPALTDTNAPARKADLPAAQQMSADPVVVQMCNEGFRELAAENGLEAIRIFREAEERDPKNTAVRFGLARLGELRAAPEAKLIDYRKRVEKCRVVIKATSILDE